MIIKIEIKEKNIRISLVDKKTVLAETIFSDEHSLGMKIIPEVDKMLHKSQKKAREVKKVLVNSDQSDSFTTTRIAKAFANGWNWGNKYIDK